LFAAQCIWWLATIIQITEILSYNRHYGIFPSDYLDNCEVPPLPSQLPEGMMIPESNIPALESDNDRDSVVHNAEEI